LSGAETNTVTPEYQTNRPPGRPRTRRTQYRLRGEVGFGELGAAAVVGEKIADSSGAEPGVLVVQEKRQLAGRCIAFAAEAEVAFEIGLETGTEAEDSPLSSLKKQSSGVGLEVGHVEARENGG